jgi:hypothetical protein
MTDSAGAIIRERRFLWNENHYFGGVQVATDGGYLITGSNDESNELLLKVSENGDSLWSRYRNEGWEEAEAVTSTDRVLPFLDYLNQAIHVNAPHHARRLVSMTKLKDMSNWLISNGYPGRINAGAGVVGNCYFLAGTYTHPLTSADSNRFQNPEVLREKISR